MILDQHGKQWKRSFGFAPKMVRADERVGGQISTYAIGFQVPLNEETTEENKCETSKISSAA